MLENAFTTVRARGPDLNIPATGPRKTNHSRAPLEGNVQRALDSKGRPTVTMPPRTTGAITIQTPVQSAASRLEFCFRIGRETVDRDDGRQAIV